MNLITIENGALIAQIAQHGAELKRLYSKKTSREYLWNGNGSWKRSSPVLFPNIGGLAGEVYVHGGVKYPAPAHGFARDMDFELLDRKDESAAFALRDSEESWRYFPFHFVLEISYQLEKNGIHVTWNIKNLDNKTMYFSIGAHPGFRLLPGTSLSDYQLVFDKPILVETRRVKGRYLTEEKELVAPKGTVLPLSPKLMERDALILEDTGLTRVALQCEKKNYALWVDFPDFPVVAVWTDPHTVEQAEFLCLEPWCGINALCGEKPGEIDQKARVTALDAGGLFQRSYRIGVSE
ncbi:Aldose 1-epimerase [uncultured Clostridium sp.]|uniref:Aldose 1-epimerase family protein n=1 Tax=Flintibacter hominis TaxID=2763048 RepID=A0A8J6M304_9FIRM|nr:aldose 1-epimerase family protein [Flintibacter hominis]MBC5722435.1 aldose 1-epimerase family protein [Flintibacter hominis]SCH05523.1 Aldose 1-epimerase [uncultured Clostridium sp.]